MPTLLPRRTLAAGALAAALLTGATADAQFRPADAIVTADQNAALRYWRAFSLMDDDLVNLVAEASIALDAATFDASPELRKAVADAEGVIDQLLRGSALPACDFGVDRELGIHALLPHLQPMRQAAILLLTDARLRLERGDRAGGAERIAAAFRMAAHAAEGEFVISSLVGLAMWDVSRRVTERLLDAGALDAESRATIRRSLSAFPASDPFHAEDAIRGEAEISVAWLRATVRETGGGDALRDALGEDAGMRMAGVVALDESELQSHIDLLSAAYTQLLAAWNAPDPEAALTQVNQEVAAGAFGELALVFLPSMTRYQRNVEKAEAQFAAFRDRLAE